MKHLHFLIPGDINTLTGGYVYDKTIIGGLRKIGYRVTVHQLAPDFPFPASESLIQCSKLIGSIPEGQPILIDSLIFSPIGEILSDLNGKNPVIAIIHLPLSRNPNFSRIVQEKLAGLEKKALNYAQKIVAVSEFTKQLLTGYGTEPSDIQVICPGVFSVPRKLNFPELPEKLLTVGSYLPGKGQLVLVQALAQLKHLSWSLTMYGIKDFDPAYVQSIIQFIESENISDRIFINSPISGKELNTSYLNADLFLLPSYFENFCMSLNEALVHGLPVITTHAGGIPYSVPHHMGLFTEPGNVGDLTEAIRSVLIDPLLYRKLYTNASHYYKTANTWENSISLFHRLLADL